MAKSDSSAVATADGSVFTVPPPPWLYSRSRPGHDGVCNKWRSRREALMKIERLTLTEAALFLAGLESEYIADPYSRRCLI